MTDPTQPGPDHDDFRRLMHEPMGPTQPGPDADRIAELKRLNSRIDRILNDILCYMKPGWDDSIYGFNKAWDIVREILKEEIDRASR